MVRFDPAYIRPSYLAGHFPALIAESTPKNSKRDWFGSRGPRCDCENQSEGGYDSNSPYTRHTRDNNCNCGDDKPSDRNACRPIWGQSEHPENIGGRLEHDTSDFRGTQPAGSASISFIGRVRSSLDNQICLPGLLPRRIREGFVRGTYSYESFSRTGVGIAIRMKLECELAERVTDCTLVGVRIHS